MQIQIDHQKLNYNEMKWEYQKIILLIVTTIVIFILFL